MLWDTSLCGYTGGILIDRATNTGRTVHFFDGLIVTQAKKQKQVKIVVCKLSNRFQKLFIYVEINRSSIFLNRKRSIVHLYREE